MNDAVAAPSTASPLAAAYERDGYFFPCVVTSEAEAAELLADIEAAEAELAGDRAKLSLLRSYPAQLLPSFARLVRHPRLIAPVAQIIGRDILVWSCGFFIKEARWNRTNARRLGLAIRYIAPSMKQTTGEKLLVSLVNGQDDYGHFEHMPPPAGRLLEEDFERARRNVAIKNAILYQGVKPELVKQTRRA